MKIPRWGYQEEIDGALCKGRAEGGNRLKIIRKRKEKEMMQKEKEIKENNAKIKRELEGSRGGKGGYARNS